MTIGMNIKRLRQNKGMTQEKLGEVLGISGQAVSKWESGAALPDIMILPALADYFGISIDELMGYKLNALTYKEQFVKFMLGNGILQTGEFQLKNGQTKNYYLDAEKFTTNAQVAKIGEYFADCIRENNVECNVVMGLAYHGIAFSTATACALFQKYGETVSYCYDRKVPDKKGRILCGYTLQDGDKVVIVDDLMSTGLTLCERIDRIREVADVEIAAVVVIADLTNEEAKEKGLGPALLAEKYGTKVYSVITDKDVEKALKDR
ncbi:MAG: helix-turn-helix domain-containing protein [Lachnospiraceae bacterium]|nr:helix-turn-helix domain-containing protein [Lachnospiraceae bacterium]